MTIANFCGKLSLQIKGGWHEKSRSGKLIGKRVSAWTSVNGEYTGTLIEVIPSRPWRGKVLIDSICKCAFHFEMGQAKRRGFRVGEEIEVGGISIEEAGDVKGFETYSQALESEIESLKQQLERVKTYAESSYIWSTLGALESSQAALFCEQERLKGKEWNWKTLNEKYQEIKKERETKDR